MFLNKQSYSNCYFLSSFFIFVAYKHIYNLRDGVYHTRKPSSSISFSIFSFRHRYYIFSYTLVFTTIFRQCFRPFFTNFLFAHFSNISSIFQTAKLFRKRKMKIKYKQTISLNGIVSKNLLNAWMHEMHH